MITNIELRYLPKDNNNSKMSTLYNFIWKNTMQSYMSFAMHNGTLIK